MHPALAIPDIIYYIVSTFVEDAEGAQDDAAYSVNKPALAACARVCRAFHLPAITALWKDGSLTIENVLLCTTPDDLWGKRRKFSPLRVSTYAVDSLFLKRAVCSADIERLLFFAPLVNRLSFGDCTDYLRHREIAEELTEEAYVSLRSILPQGLFCNLRHLTWRGDSANLNHLPSFLSPSLASLQLNLCEAPVPHLSILTDLPLSCPNISEFSLSYQNYDHEEGKMKEALKDLIRAWDLRDLHTNIIARESLADLGRLPFMKHLLITPIVSSRLLPGGPLAMAPKAFSSLVELRLDSIDARSCITLMHNSKFNALAELRLSLNDAVAGDWVDLYRAIRAAVVRPDLVENLTLDLEPAISHDERPEARVPVTGDDIVPLFDFRGLQLIALQSTGGFDLGHPDVVRLAKAFSHLQGITLMGTEYHPQWQRRLDLYSLEPLALYCPGLEIVAIELDATGTELARRPPPSYQPSAISWLLLLWSPISSSRAVVSYLLSWFPQLVRVLVEEHSSYAERWQRVQEQIMAQAIAREEQCSAEDDPAQAPDTSNFEGAIDFQCRNGPVSEQKNEEMATPARLQGSDITEWLR